MNLFEVALAGHREPRRLLVVAEDEREARALAVRPGDRVDSVMSHGGFRVLGRSRILGTVELEQTGPEDLACDN